MCCSRWSADCAAEWGTLAVPASSSSALNRSSCVLLRRDSASRTHTTLPLRERHRTTRCSFLDIALSVLPSSGALQCRLFPNPGVTLPTLPEFSHGLMDEEKHRCPAG